MKQPATALKTNCILTLEQLHRMQATGLDSTDLRNDTGDDTIAEGVSGRVYCNGAVYTEDTRSWDGRRGSPPGRWYVGTDNCEYFSDDLQEAEERICEFAVHEGYIR